MRPSLAELENPKTLIHESVTAKDVTVDVLAPIFAKPHPMWVIGLIISLLSFAAWALLLPSRWPKASVFSVLTTQFSGARILRTSCSGLVLATLVR